MDHIEELTVNVANDNDGLLDADHVRLISYTCHTSALIQERIDMVAKRGA